MSDFSKLVKHEYPHEWGHLHIVVDTLCRMDWVPYDKYREFCRVYVTEHFAEGERLRREVGQQAFHDYVEGIALKAFPPPPPPSPEPKSSKVGLRQILLSLKEKFTGLF